MKTHTDSLYRTTWGRVVSIYPGPEYLEIEYEVTGQAGVRFVAFRCSDFEAWVERRTGQDLGYYWDNYHRAEDKVQIDRDIMAFLEQQLPYGKLRGMSRRHRRQRMHYRRALRHLVHAQD